VVHVNVRLPADLHARAVAMAKAEHRSLNGLILALIEQAARKTPKPSS
jgi:predicted HicB family RNase H-like nuclease